MTRPGSTVFLLALGWLLVSSACQPAPPPASRYKFFVSADGFYRVTGAALEAAGADLARIDPATLQLYNGDREVAIRVNGQGKDLAVDFYGQATDSPYSAFNVYWLRWGVQNGKRMREVQSPAETGNHQESFQDTARLSQPTLFIPQPGPVSDSWFWQALAAPITTTVPITLPTALAAPAQLRVNVWGSTQDAANPDHHLRVFFNDTWVADEKWDGQGPRGIAATVPAPALRSGPNNIRLVAPGDTGAVADIVLLRSVEVTYTRRLGAVQDQLAFEGARGSYRLEEFSGDAIDLLDITNPEEPARVANARISAGTLAFDVDETRARRWLAAGPKAHRPVARIAPMQDAKLRAPDRQADYVVVTHPDFVNALQPLVRWRSEHGLKTAVVTTAEIYDEFGNGFESPLAIRAFLDYVQREWAKPAPRFALFVGKASYDYRDYVNGPNKNLVPTFLVETPGLSLAASDNWFAARSNTDPHPSMGIGRIPAKTPAEVARVAAKTIAYESAARGAGWRQNAIFVADDKEPTFVEMSDALIGMLPGLAARQVYLGGYKGDVDAARHELLSRWNEGALLLTYIGHGSVDTWAAGPLLSPDDMPAIRNGERLPVLLTPTCLDGFFYHPQQDSLTELLLFKEDGGIIAGVAPTGLSFPKYQAELMNALFAELFNGPAPTLGEALMRAKQKLDLRDEETREVIETFGLLGDPALEMR